MRVGCSVVGEVHVFEGSVFFFLRFVLKFLYQWGVGGKGLLADTMRGGGEAAFKRDALLKDCTWISKVDRGSWWDVVL